MAAQIDPARDRSSMAANGLAPVVCQTPAAFRQPSDGSTGASRQVAPDRPAAPGRLASRARSARSQAPGGSPQGGITEGGITRDLVIG